MGSINAQHKGFTLIELLLVLVVVSVMLSLAMAVLPDRNASRMANEAVRLVKVLDTLQLEAMLQRTQSGLLVDEDGYRAAILNLYTLEWESSDLKILAPRQLQADGMVLRLVNPPEGADESFTPGETAGDTDTDTDTGNKNYPAIVFDASGVSDPYRLQLAHNSGLSALVDSDGLHGAKLQ